MPDRQPFLNDDATTGPESPRHGFQGDRRRGGDLHGVPAALTVAISREAGSRGTSIAHRAGAKLGWQVYTQEMLEYLTQEGGFRQNLLDQLAPTAAHWVEEQLEQGQRAGRLSRHPSVVDMARLILALGVTGEVILIGRGAGYVLPARSTLHVRLVAPLQDRVKYMSQWLRLTVEEAAEQVRLRDERRADFTRTHYQHQPGELYQYDLVLNTSLLGEELCAQLIVQAARAKLAGWALSEEVDPT
jgi:cytidylate kinase